MSLSKLFYIVASLLFPIICHFALAAFITLSPPASASNGGIFSDRFEPPDFFLDENGVTVRCPEAQLGDQGDINGVLYTKRSREHINTENASTTCTSGMTDMSGMFEDTHWYFNQPLESWDTSAVTTMRRMFLRAKVFNQPIGSWDTSNVINLGGMFNGARAFNQPLDSWDTSAATNMAHMFYYTRVFNQPLGSWDTSNVIDMSGMFGLAEGFNQDLSGWCVTLIPTFPPGFTGLPSNWTEPKPVWGTCPDN